MRHPPWRDRPLFAPDYRRSEVFAHVGGFPLGLAFDRAAISSACVGAMGLYSIARDRNVTKLSAETHRSWTSIVDDARLRDPNDCDIAPDGRIYFTDSTKRYDAHDWALDSIENRATGRLLVYDPRTARRGRCSTAIATPTASAWRMMVSRCSSPKSGPARSIAIGSTDQAPAASNA